MKKIESWVEYFNERAKSFNLPTEIGNHYIGDDVVNDGFIEYERERLLSYFQPNKQEEVYDLGCGAGFSTNLVSDYFTKSVGIDMGIDLIAKAKQSYPTLDFVLDNIVTLSKFENGSMKNVLMYGVLHQMGAEKEIINCLKSIAEKTQKDARVVLYKIPDKRYYDQYQVYRKLKNANNGNRNTAPDDLTWVWIDESFLYEHLNEYFEIIINRPCWGAEMPFKAWFDCVLIRK